MSALRVAGACIAAFELAACSGPRTQAVPAVLVALTAEGRAELVRVVAEAAGVTSVTIAADAFTRDSTLVLEQAEPGTLAGRIATGRTLTEPVRVNLVLRGERCMLARARDGREWQLHGVTCAPATVAAAR